MFWAYYPQTPNLPDAADVAAMAKIAASAASSAASKFSAAKLGCWGIATFGPTLWPVIGTAGLAYISYRGVKLLVRAMDAVDAKTP